jgi:hypothetical protein
MNSIIKHSKVDIDGHILAMLLLWASRPSNAEPDENGRYFIGAVENAPEKNWARPIGPYSVAERRE